MKNLFAITEALSVMLILFFVYFKTKNKCFLWGVIFALFFAAVLFGVKNSYIPGVLGLVTSGIALVLAIIFVEIEDSKNKGKAWADLNSILVINKKNALFWGFVIVLNLIGFLLEE